MLTRQKEPSVDHSGNTSYTRYIRYVTFVFLGLSKCGKSVRTNLPSSTGMFIQKAAISINLRKRIIKMQIIVTFYGNIPAEFCQLKWLQIYKYISTA